MAGISLTVKGTYEKVRKYLELLKAVTFENSFLNKIGETGVKALAAATPVDSGLTASSWKYTITVTDGDVQIVWENTNVVDGWYNVAIGLNYGHVTGTGGWVEGAHYIDKVIQPVFDAMAKELEEEVRKL